MLQTRSAAIGTALAGALLFSVQLTEGKPNDPYGPVPDCDNAAEQQPAERGKRFSDPINIATGDFQEVQTDLYLPGRGLDFHFTRTYRSRSNLHSIFQVMPMNQALPLGAYWSHNYDLRIIDEGAQDGVHRVGYFPGNGRCDSFVESPELLAQLGKPVGWVNARYYVLDGYDGYIIYDDATGSAEYVTGSNTVYRFENVSSSYYGGRLTRITDRNGNEMQFEDLFPNDGFDRLDAVIDSRGETIRFRYHDDPASPRGNGWFDRYLLWKVEDPFGRVVEYNYESAIEFLVVDRLVSVRLPAIVADNDFMLPIEHERFPAGREWEYVYDLRYDDYWDGQITNIIDPVNTAAASPQARVENEYYRPAVGAYDRFDLRVKDQTYGGDTYEYRVTGVDGVALDEFIPFKPDAFEDDYEVWVRDRRGYVTRFHYRGELSGENRRLWQRTEYAGVHGSLPDGVAVSISPASYGPPARVESYEYNSDWDLQSTTFDNGDTETITRLRDLGSIDPRSAAAVADITRSGVNPETGFLETISESWQYRFSFDGGPSGGCCGATFATSHTDGRGFVTFYVYDTNPRPFTDSPTGNLLAIYHDLPPGTDPTLNTESAISAVAPADVAMEHFEYNQWGQVVKHTHPHHMTRNSSGIFSEHRRVDTFEYGTAGFAKGRLVTQTIDEGHTNLVTSYEYDAIGNVVRITEPDGDVTLRLFNQAHQLIRERRFADGATPDINADGMSGRDHYYDANGNRVRTDELNLVPSGAGGFTRDTANPTFTSLFAYDRIDRLTFSARSIATPSAGSVDGLADVANGTYTVSSLASDPNWVVTESRYNAGGLLAETRSPEAVRGNQPDNVTAYEYDERELLIRTTRGGNGDAIPVVTAFEYDQRGRRRAVVLNPGADERRTASVYDAFGRVVCSTDAMGNETRYAYDDNGNLLEVTREGERLDGSGGAGNEVLAKSTMEYDARDRMRLTHEWLFEEGQTPSPLSVATYETVYNRDGSIQIALSPSGGGTATEFTFYDTAGRLTFSTDALGNYAEYHYDSGSNVTSVVRTDVESGTDQVFVTGYTHDSMDRPVSMTEGAFAGGPSNTSTMEYDSRGNLLETVDARLNVTRYTYDGLSRRLTTETLMTTNGRGGGPQAANPNILTQTLYDANSRVQALIDDNGSPTFYAYDELDRNIIVRMGDGTLSYVGTGTVTWDNPLSDPMFSAYQPGYNAFGDQVSRTDANGTVMSAEYDDLGRAIRVVHQLGATVAGGVNGVEEQAYAYDGLSRLVSALDTDSWVSRSWDSRSLLRREVVGLEVARDSQNELIAVGVGREVEYSYDDAGNQTVIDHPSGRSISRTFDRLDRLQRISDATAPTPAIVAEYEYVGANRPGSRTFANGVTALYSYNGYEGATPPLGDVGVGQMTRIIHTTDALNPANSAAWLDAREFAWDRAGNKIAHRDLTSSNIFRRHRAFSYDSADRLVSSSYSTEDPFAPSLVFGDLTYTLDGVHNRDSVVVNGHAPSTESVHSFVEVFGTSISTAAPGAGFGSYTLDPALDDDDVNQYTFTPSREYRYDDNGNMIQVFAACSGDANGDFLVNADDYLAVSGTFGKSFGDDGYDPAGDLNGDDTVNADDLLIVLGAWGSSCFNADLGYDHRNQLVAFAAFDGTILLRSAEYRYDALNRRTAKIVDGDGDGFVTGASPDDEHTEFVYAGQAHWQMIEEYDALTLDALGDPSLRASYVYGNYIDEVLQAERHDQGVTPETFYYHQDDLFSVYAITDESGAVVERYDYSDYGEVETLHPGGARRTSGSVVGNRHTYTGRAVELESGLLQYRHRYLVPVAGRFAQRDPLGFIDSMNPVAYARSRPVSLVDALGLRCSFPVSYEIKAEDAISGIEFATLRYSAVLDCCECTVSQSKLTWTGLKGIEFDAFGTSLGIGLSAQINYEITNWIPCSDSECDEEGDRCMLEVEIEAFETILFVKYSLGKRRAGWKCQQCY